jgi:hypothetical protein
MEFFRCARATNHVAGFEHERFVTRFGEIISGNETVEAGADDNYGFHVSSFRFQVLSKPET